MAPARRACARSHIAGSSAFDPAPSTNEAVYSTWTAFPAAKEALNGAPVSGSHATIRVDGDVAASALAIPVVSPPPPQGTSTASMPSRRSASSRPITPFPAITRSSSTGCTKSPSTPG